MRFGLMFPVVSGLLIVGAGLALGERTSPKPGFVGSETCAGCHQEAAAAWSRSHHAWAWKKPDETTVKGNFDDAVIEHRGVRSRFFRDGERFMIRTDNASGELATFEVRSVAGIEPLQQYLLETEGGRLQALDLAWDTVGKRWYHLYPDQDLKGGDGLHWTGPYKSWNARCAECHATDYHKNYSARTRSYASTQAEIGVGCEACHGPGEAHVAWARDNASQDGRSGAGRAIAGAGLTDTGLTIGFDGSSPESEIQQCAGCHSRREPLGDASPLPGTPYHDAYRLALLRPGLYHADGSIQDEVYVYGSFLQSRMYAQGVRCSDCHEPHAATLKAEGNAVCTQCHSPAGNDRFPTLKKNDYDDPAHHFHEVGSAGAQCRSCHMIERTYMGVDPRRDHSFRVPRPDLTAQTGAPNACTDCHADKEPSWAAGELERRFPRSDHRGPHVSQLFARARKDPAGAMDELLALARDTSEAGIVRATALDLASAAATPAHAGKAAALVTDTDALVRGAAVGLQRAAPPQDRLERLLPALQDRYATVRIAAARALLGAPVSRLPAPYGEALGKSQREWRASLLAKADFPETHVVLGGTALVLRNPRAAERAFREAVRQDPQLADAWRMIVRIRAALGDREGATKAADEGLMLNPDNDMLHEIRKQLD